MTTAYVGCRTTQKRYAHGKGISLYTLDAKGNWTLQEITKTLDNPAWLVFDRTKNYLYTVHGDGHEVSAFAVRSGGDLQFLNTVDSQGKNPVYGTVTFNNKFLLVASLQGGAVASLPIQPDGSLGEAVSLEHFEGPKEGGISHAHACVLDCTGNFLLVPTQAREVGYDRVWVLQVNQETGKLTRVSYTEARKYDEPRHLVFSKDNKYVYLVNEKASTLRVFDFDDKKGVLTPKQGSSYLTRNLCRPQYGQRHCAKCRRSPCVRVQSDQRRHPAGRRRLCWLVPGTGNHRQLCH